MAKEKESAKLIVIMEFNSDGQFIQSPENRKSYKTFEGADANLIGFGAPPTKLVEENPKFWVVEWTYKGETKIFYLVDILAEAQSTAALSKIRPIYKPDPDGIVRTEYESGEIHYPDGIVRTEYESGEIRWTFKGKLHREDGPAIEHPEQKLSHITISYWCEWYINGKRWDLEKALKSKTFQKKYPKLIEAMKNYETLKACHEN